MLKLAHVPLTFHPALLRTFDETLPGSLDGFLRLERNDMRGDVNGARKLPGRWAMRWGKRDGDYERVNGNLEDTRSLSAGAR